MHIEMASPILQIQIQEHMKYLDVKAQQITQFAHILCTALIGDYTACYKAMRIMSEANNLLVDECLSSLIIHWIITLVCLYGHPARPSPEQELGIIG